MIVTIFLTDPYIVVIATIVTQLFCSWSEGRRERGETGLGRGKQNTKIIRREELWPKNTQLSYPASAALTTGSASGFTFHLSGFGANENEAWLAAYLPTKTSPVVCTIPTELRTCTGFYIKACPIQLRIACQVPTTGNRCDSLIYLQSIKNMNKGALMTVLALPKT